MITLALGKLREDVECCVEISQRSVCPRVALNCIQGSCSKEGKVTERMGHGDVRLTGDLL